MGPESAEKKKQTPSQLRISKKDLQIKEYDDTLTARIVESIKVKSRNEIEIQFVGGYKGKEDVELKKNHEGKA